MSCEPVTRSALTRGGRRSPAGPLCSARPPGRLSRPVQVRALQLLAWLALAPALAALEVPYLAGRVNDLADLMADDVEQRITAKLAAFEEATGAQVAVLTIPSLEGEVLEEYSLRVAETWGLGRAEEDDGVLLLVARDDRKMRIEVGYGLEGRLTDLQSGRILRNVLRPAFREGEFGRGIEEGVDLIVATLQGDDVIPADPPRRVTSDAPWPARILGLLLFLGFLSLFMLSALFSSGCSGWFLYLFLVPFLVAFPSAIVHPKVGVALAAVWLIAFPILKLILAYTGWGKRFTKEYPGLSRWGRSGGSSWSGGGFSSGGFSGGGGSFGGGGASSSW